MVIDGTTVTDGKITVDLTTVKSDRGRRDNQFQGRIMDTSQFPDATFELTQPIALGTEPADGDEIKVTATGDLTLHGTTKSVTTEITGARSGNTIEASGAIPITFSDYDIDDPTGGPAQVGDDGTLEFLVVLSLAAMYVPRRDGREDPRVLRHTGADDGAPVRHVRGVPG